MKNIVNSFRVMATKEKKHSRKFRKMIKRKNEEERIRRRYRNRKKSQKQGIRKQTKNAYKRVTKVEIKMRK